MPWFFIRNEMFAAVRAGSLCWFYRGRLSPNWGGSFLGLSILAKNRSLCATLRNTCINPRDQTLSRTLKVRMPVPLAQVLGLPQFGGLVIQSSVAKPSSPAGGDGGLASRCCANDFRLWRSTEVEIHQEHVGFREMNGYPEWLG